MITIRELFNVTHTIDRIDVSVYDPARPMVDRKVTEWLIGWPEEHRFGRSLQWDIEAGRAEVFPIKINARDYPGSDGRYGLQPKVLPDALLDAPVSSLLMRCRDGARYEITVRVDLQTLTVEAMRMEGKKDG